MTDLWLTGAINIWSLPMVTPDYRYTIVHWHDRLVQDRSLLPRSSDTFYLSISTSPPAMVRNNKVQIRSKSSRCARKFGLNHVRPSNKTNASEDPILHRLPVYGILCTPNRREHQNPLQDLFFDKTPHNIQRSESQDNEIV
ncbi:hypothetical protein VTL71DRAFT_3992, partial [Oculimacula yallundae]